MRLLYKRSDLKRPLYTQTDRKNGETAAALNGCQAPLSVHHHYLSLCFLDDYREEARIERWMDKHLFAFLIGAIVYTILSVVMLIVTRKKN